MSIDTAPHSAFPPPIVDLLPRVRELAAELGETPSRNRIKRELKVGAPKASALRDALLADDTPEPATVPGEPAESAPVPVEPEPEPAEPAPDEPVPALTVTPVPAPLPIVAADPDSTIDTPAPVAVAGPLTHDRSVRSWPVLLLALPAFVAIWSGWVGLGGLTGFGMVHPLPGIWDRFELNTAITLPIGVETYAAFALRVWLSGGVPRAARRFAKWSAIGSLMLGAAGQVAYHLMAATHIDHAPWQITTLVASLPVAVLGMGAALAHLLHDTSDNGK